MANPIYHSQYTAAQIEAAIGHGPRVNTSGYWEVWNVSTMAYESTGVGAGVQPPTVVTQASQMTNPGYIYIYNGSEAGFTAGYWYYWDGTAWTAGGAYQVAATDPTLSVSGGVADAKIVGNALNAGYAQLDWSPGLTLGKYIKFGDGTEGTSNKYCRTTLWNGYHYRIAVEIADPTYTCSVAYFAAGGSVTTGAGFLGHDAYTTGMHYIPMTAILFGLSFRRADQATMTSDDLTAISAALKAYGITDNTLTQKGIAADSQIVGKFFTGINDEDGCPLTFSKAGTGFIKWADGTTASGSGSQSWTAYIDVSGYTHISCLMCETTAETTASGIAFYDSSYTFIRGRRSIPGQAALGYRKMLWDVPPTAKYVRCTIYTDTETYGPYEIYGIKRINADVEDLSAKSARNTYHQVHKNFRSWSKGNLDSADGENKSSNTRCYSRSVQFPSAVGKVTFTVKTGYAIRIFEYLTQAQTGTHPTTFTGRYVSTTNSVYTTSIDPAKYYRLEIRRTDSSTLEPTDLPLDAIMWEYDSIYPKRDREYVGTTYFWSMHSVNVNSGWPDDSLTTTDNAETGTTIERNVALVLPGSYSAAGKPTPLVMFGHGASCSVSSLSWYGNNANCHAMLKAVRDAGYAIFDVDNSQARTDGWQDYGSLPLMETYIKAWQYIKENYNVTDRLWILSDSMGTAASLNMLKWYGSQIVCAVQTAPRPLGGMERYPEASTWQKKSLLVAYGLEPVSIMDDPDYVCPDVSVFDGKFEGFRQLGNIIEIGDTEMVLKNFPPLKVMVGTSDTDFLEDVRRFYAALKNAGNFVDYREVTGADHSVMSFLSQGNLKAEAIAFMDRFREGAT